MLTRRDFLILLVQWILTTESMPLLVTSLQDELMDTAGDIIPRPRADAQAVTFARDFCVPIAAVSAVAET